jgi:hypothetical protein
VLEETEAAYLGSPCRVEDVLRRGGDLEAALDHLVAHRQGGLAARAAILGLQVGRWWGSQLLSSRVTALLALRLLPELRAQLLLYLSEADDFDVPSISAVVEQALALTNDPDTRWKARSVLIGYAHDRSPGDDGPLEALLAASERPEDPAPPDIRAFLDLCWAKRKRFTASERRGLLVEALARLERARWGSPLPDVWLADSRAALLCELAAACTRLDDLAGAASALTEAEKVAPPRMAGAVGWYKAGWMSRQGRWAEADRLLDRLTWEPVHRHFPTAQVRLLARRAGLAVVHGQDALAMALAEQVEWMGERLALASAGREARQIRAWLAAAAGQTDEVERLAPTAFPPGSAMIEALAEIARVLASDLAEPEAHLQLAPSLRRLEEQDQHENRRGLLRLLDRVYGMREPATSARPGNYRSSA